MKAHEKSKNKSQKVKNQQLAAKPNLFDKSEKWFFRNQKFLFIILSVIFIILSLLMFSLRISEGGDDSTYIHAAHNYAKDFFHYYFTFNAHFYPIFLSFFVWIFGINMYILKLLSLFFSYFHIFFFYKALKNRIPLLILFPVLLLICTNSFFLFFASQTYNEAFFLFFQSLLFYYFMRLEDKISTAGSAFKSTYKLWLIIGLLVFILSMTKNVAIVVLAGITVYLLLNKRFLHIVYLLGSYLVFKIPFELLKISIWGNLSQYNSQKSILMQVHPYDKSRGLETFTGFINRFFNNCQIYFSDILFQIFGFRKEYTNVESTPLTILIVLLILIGIILIIRSKNKSLQFITFYGASIIFSSFILLQILWSQHRIILIELPVILIVIFFVLYKFLNRKVLAGFQFLYFFLIILIFISGLISTSKKIKHNLPIIYHNIKGDRYYGYSPDWKNYLLMSDWCAHNLSKTDKIACRKPSVSFLFTNCEQFYGVFEAKTTNPDSSLAFFKKNQVTHLLLASLRLNPSMPTMNIYNSLQRMVYPIAVQYPYKIQFVHQFGTEEPAYLYKINY